MFSNNSTGYTTSTRAANNDASDHEATYVYTKGDRNRILLSPQLRDEGFNITSMNSPPRQQSQAEPGPSLALSPRVGFGNPRYPPGIKPPPQTGSPSNSRIISQLIEDRGRLGADIAHGFTSLQQEYNRILAAQEERRDREVSRLHVLLDSRDSQIDALFRTLETVRGQMMKLEKEHREELAALNEKLSKAKDDLHTTLLRHERALDKIQRHLDPISFRCLIDATREVIIGWFPDASINITRDTSTTWRELWKYLEDSASSREARDPSKDSISHVADIIYERQNYASGKSQYESFTTNGKKHKLRLTKRRMNRETITEVIRFGMGSIVQEGNEAAHEINTENIRDAITSPSPSIHSRVPCLKEMFCVAFGYSDFPALQEPRY